MHQVTLLDSRGRQLVIDFDNLFLADGTRARDYQEPADLYRKLKAMRVPEVEVGMGTYQLLVCLGRFRAATKIDQVTGRPAAEGNAA
jgi:hypothetical protein